MRTLVEILAMFLLAIPVALLIIFGAPGLGLLLAIILVAIVFYVRAKRIGNTDKAHRIRQHKNAA